MSHILRDCKGVLCYLDDILLYGKTKKEHKSNLHVVLSQITAAGLKLNEKCIFNVPDLSFLSHRVSGAGILPLQSNLEAMKEAPTPTDLSSLPSFL